MERKTSRETELIAITQERSSRISSNPVRCGSATPLIGVPTPSIGAGWSAAIGRYYPKCVLLYSTTCIPPDFFSSAGAETTPPHPERSNIHSDFDIVLSEDTVCENLIHQFTTYSWIFTSLKVLSKVWSGRSFETCPGKIRTAFLLLGQINDTTCPF